MSDRPTSMYGTPVVWIPAASGNYDSNRQGTDLIIVHDIEGTASGAISRFQTPNQQASTQAVADTDNNRIVQMVDFADVAYGCGNYYYNQRGDQIELPGYSGKPYDSKAIDLAVKFGAARAVKNNVPIVRRSLAEVVQGLRGFCGHQDIPDPNNPSLGGGADHHTDPGPTFPWDDFLSRVNALTKGQQPNAPDACRYFAETKHYLCHGFRAFWESYGDKALPTFGYPISEEFTNADKLVVQYFERARFEWHPGCGQPFDVMLGRLGDEADQRDRTAHPEAFAPKEQK